MTRLWLRSGSAVTTTAARKAPTDKQFKVFIYADIALWHSCPTLGPFDSEREAIAAANKWCEPFIAADNLTPHDPQRVKPESWQRGKTSVVNRVYETAQPERYGGEEWPLTWQVSRI